MTQPRDTQGRFAVPEAARTHGATLTALTTRPPKHAGLIEAMYPTLPPHEQTK
jgi:hypothetical protein